MLNMTGGSPYRNTHEKFGNIRDYWVEIGCLCRIFAVSLCYDSGSCSDASRTMRMPCLPHRDRASACRPCRLHAYRGAGCPHDAQCLTVSADTVSDLLHRGDLPGRKVGRTWLTTTTAVLRWLEASTTRSTKAQEDAALARAMAHGDREPWWLPCTTARRVSTANAVRPRRKASPGRGAPGKHRLMATWDHGLSRGERSIFPSPRLGKDDAPRGRARPGSCASPLGSEQSTIAQREDATHAEGGEHMFTLADAARIFHTHGHTSW